MLLSELICSVRGQVFTGCGSVSDAQIAQYVRSAMCLVNLLGQSFLSTTKRVKLCPGAVHSVPGCSKLTGIIGQTDKDGLTLVKLPDLTEKEERFQARMQRAGFATRCPISVDPCAKFTIKSVDIVANGKQVVVSPAVPTDADVWLLVECAGSLELIEPGKDGVIPCEWEEVIVQWVLFKITFPQATDEYTFPRANTHAKMFAELLQVSMDSLAKASANEENTASES